MDIIQMIFNLGNFCCKCPGLRNPGRCCKCEIEGVRQQLIVEEQRRLLLIKANEKELAV
jgi:hypothetical protein